MTGGRAGAAGFAALRPPKVAPVDLSTLLHALVEVDLVDRSCMKRELD